MDMSLRRDQKTFASTWVVHVFRRLYSPGEASLLFCYCIVVYNDKNELKVFKMYVETYVFYFYNLV